MAPTPSQQFTEITTSEPPPEPRTIMRRAVVLGGSIAGLMAARVLSDHAEEVLVVERDGTDPATGPRPGVPQGSQVHALLPAGQVQFDRWFPGFTEEAMRLGAPPPDDRLPDMFINGKLRVAPFPPSPTPALLTTRPFLETLVRRRTLARDNVRLVHGSAEGLLVEDGRVTGARYLPAEDGADGAVTVDADLVVDATGRGSRINDWLTENGGSPAPLRRMPIKLNYATALFERDKSVSDTFVAVVQTTPGPGRTARIGGINTVEGNRWIMLVAGYGDDRPTRDPADFTARCRRDFPPMFGDIAEHGRRIGDVVTYHQADSRRRDFHRLDALPAGLVVAGDAVASFNPVYGQGMTSAALHASCLSSYLAAGPRLRDEPARAYFDRVRVVVDAAWQISTFADLGLPHVTEGQPPGYRLIRWFGDAVLDASLTDAVVHERVHRVTTMLEHPSALAGPGLLARAVRIRLTG